MNFLSKQNVTAVIFAGLLSWGVYSFVITNPSFLQADIQGVVSNENKGDVVYDIIDGSLIIKAGKNYSNIESLSALLSFDTAKVSLIKESLKGVGDISIAYEDGSAQVTLVLHQSMVTAGTELFRIGLQGTDVTQLVVNDIVLIFKDGTSDAVRVGVEN